MYLIDTHCHLDAETRAFGLGAIYANCLMHGVQQLFCVGFDIASSEEGLQISADTAGGMPEVWAAVGVHPHEASSLDGAAVKRLEAMLKDSRCVALGEIGLDFFYDNSPRDVQREAFCAQIELALRARKPIITHIRDTKERAGGNANTESIQLLRACGAERVGGIIHCFSGNMADAEAALEMGFYISFAGPVTYPKNEALRRIAADIPLDRLLCETDAPYLAPQKFRGRPNEPANVSFVYDKIAEVLGMVREELADAVCANVNRLYGWERNV